MAYEKKDGDIVIFKQDKKSDKAPAYKGELFLDGKTLEVALWVKNGSRGEFWAGSVKEQDPKYAKASTPSYGSGNPTKRAVQDIDDSEIPFNRMK